MPFNSKVSPQKMTVFQKEVTIVLVMLGDNMLAHTFKFNAILSMHAVNNSKNLENKWHTGILLLPTEDTPQSYFLWEETSSICKQKVTFKVWSQLMINQHNYQLYIHYLCITFIYWLSFGNTIKEEINYTKAADLTKIKFRNQRSFWSTYVAMGKQSKTPHASNKAHKITDRHICISSDY